MAKEIKLSDLPQSMAALVQMGLKARGLYHGTTQGIPGPNTEAAYQAFLASIAKRNDPLPLAVQPSILRAALIEIARSKIGVTEKGGNNRGPEVQEFQDAASYLPGTGWAWCAAFVGWCFDRLAERYALPFATPEGAGAFWYEDWARAQGVKVLPGSSKVKAGDLIIYSFSHIGIATADETASGTFLCVEGNTNGEGSREGDGVYEKRRGKSQVRSIIRPFP